MRLKVNIERLRTFVDELQLNEFGQSNPKSNEGQMDDFLDLFKSYQYPDPEVVIHDQEGSAKNLNQRKNG